MEAGADNYAPPSGLLRDSGRVWKPLPADGGEKVLVGEKRPTLLCAFDEACTSTSPISFTWIEASCLVVLVPCESLLS